MVYENRVLKRISETKEEDVKGELRRLHNEESLNSCSSIIIIKVEKSRMVRWVGQVARTRKRNVYEILVGKSETKRRFRKLRSI
jgi:hypothetical protein